MAYKRQVDRLPIIPADAKEQNVTCHYCIVGCGYKAYTWPVNKQGTATSNKFGVDLSQQQSQETEYWYSPSMYNIVQQDGRDVHLVIKPDVNCSVNSGLGSVRGARMAENRRSDVTGTQQQRLHGADGVALRHVAADLMERCSRSRSQGYRPLHRQGQRGQSLCLDVRPWRLGGRL